MRGKNKFNKHNYRSQQTEKKYDLLEAVRGDESGKLGAFVNTLNKIS